MEELELAERPGFFSRVKDYFSRGPEVDEEQESAPTGSIGNRHPSVHRYSITVRRQIVSFQDAVAAADGLKRGEAQLLNLTAADPALREKIKDFMCGVNYAEEGTWEEVGEHVYLLAPPLALVEVAPATPRMAAVRN
ncbi:MAG TPA: cell division protein SepF [Fimbriimonadaceae bacterium]|nr:cell division protein SepF [Fimbriimonadaceae bacterium]